RSTAYGQPTGSKVGTVKSEECCAALKNSWKAIASPRRTMSHNMDHNQYRFEGSSIERVNQKPFTSLNQNPCDQYDHQKPVANAVGKNGAWYDRSNSYIREEHITIIAGCRGMHGTRFKWPTHWDGTTTLSSREITIAD